MSVYEKIDKALQSQKMSRRQLALKAGIPPSTLQSVMERQRNITYEMLKKIADALFLRLAYLVDDGPEETFSFSYNYDGESLPEDFGAPLYKTNFFKNLVSVMWYSGYKLEYIEGKYLFTGKHDQYTVEEPEIESLLDNFSDFIEWSCAKFENGIRESMATGAKETPTKKE